MPGLDSNPWPALHQAWGANLVKSVSYFAFKGLCASKLYKIFPSLSNVFNFFRRIITFITEFLEGQVRNGILKWLKGFFHYFTFFLVYDFVIGIFFLRKIFTQALCNVPGMPLYPF